MEPGTENATSFGWWWGLGLCVVVAFVVGIGLGLWWRNRYPLPDLRHLNALKGITRIDMTQVGHQREFVYFVEEHALELRTLAEALGSFVLPIKVSAAVAQNHASIHANQEVALPFHCASPADCSNGIMYALWIMRWLQSIENGLTSSFARFHLSVLVQLGSDDEIMACNVMVSALEEVCQGFQATDISLLYTTTSLVVISPHAQSHLHDDHGNPISQCDVCLIPASDPRDYTLVLRAPVTPQTKAQIHRCLCRITSY